MTPRRAVDGALPGGDVPVVQRSTVEVRRRVIDKKAVAGFGGLTLCGSVWACPRCSAVISFTRAAEVASAVKHCTENGGQVHLLTLTVRHRASDRLEDLWPIVSAGWRAVTGTVEWTGRAERERGRKGRKWIEPEVIGDRENFRIAGVVRVFEVTVSRPGDGGHGWHVHIHALLFTESGLSVALAPEWREMLREAFCEQFPERDFPHFEPEHLARIALQCRVAGRWRAGVEKAGGRSPGEASVDLRTIADGGAEFVGRYLAKATYDAAAAMGFEMTAGMTGKSARRVNVTPFELLSEAVESEDWRIVTPKHWRVDEAVDTDTGELLAGRLDLVDLTNGDEVRSRLNPPPFWRRWIEFEQASRGRHQLEWSKEPKEPRNALERLWKDILAARGRTADESNEDVAKKELDGIVLGEITRLAWNSVFVRKPSLMVDALEAAERGADDLREWMTVHGIDYDPR